MVYLWVVNFIEKFHLTFIFEICGMNSMLMEYSVPQRYLAKAHGDAFLSWKYVSCVNALIV